MVKMFSILLILVVSAFCQSAWVSSESKIDIDTLLTQRYGNPVPLAGSSSFYVITKVNDIRAVGFKTDSIKGATGYRTLCLTGDKQGNKDTIFSAVTWLDTASLVTPNATNMDTLSVSDFAIYRSPVFTPAVNQFLQPVFKPMTGTRGLMNVGWIVLDIQRLTATYVKSSE